MAINMKTDKPSIKIIKREEREMASGLTPPRKDQENRSGDGRGKATSTVTGWVREFQSRRRAEQTQALTMLREELAPLSEDDRGLMPAGA
jgi:hypothetical protein